MNEDTICIMLIDDNENDNFFHERKIKKTVLATTVIAKESDTEALGYLDVMINEGKIGPILIFLDINMPGMNGWKFLTHYNQLEIAMQKAIVIVMLTISYNP